MGFGKLELPLTMESFMRKEVKKVAYLTDRLIQKLKAVQVKVTLRDHREGVSAKLIKK